MMPLALIVEDNKNMADAFFEALVLAGYTAEIALDGAVAVTKLTYGPIPHLVLLDLNLPNVKGGAILDMIRRNERLTDTRVIVVTANDREAEVYRDTADLVLLKPVGFSQIKDIASRMLPRDKGSNVIF